MAFPITLPAHALLYASTSFPRVTCVVSDHAGPRNIFNGFIFTRGIVGAPPIHGRFMIAHTFIEN